MSLADELEKLSRIHQAGGLTEEEYARAKAAAIAAQPHWANADIELQTQQWAMALHLSLLAGLLIPIAGLVVPILIWQLKKTELPGLDVHGKIVMNWLISFVIYVAISAVLVLVLIGIPLLVIFGVLGILFPVIGAINASNGKIWVYPFSIQFIK